MENKIVCDYCGTIYNADKKVCPLCGNAPGEEAKSRQKAIQRRRDGDENRRVTPKKQPDAAADPKRIPKKLAISALVFLALSVFVWFYFIGDAIMGWWPGLSSVLNADYGAKDASGETTNKSCTYLEILPESIDFTEQGQIQKLRVIINAGCEETVTFTTDNDKVINVSTDAPKSDTQEEQTAITVDVTALTQGTASITVSCGNKSRTCKVTCDFDGTAASDSTAQSEFVPKLNYDGITMQFPRDTVTLRVENLPDGKSVRWSSTDASVAAVDDEGKVTAIGAGTAQIIAEVDGARVETTIRCDFEGTTEKDDGTHLTHTDVSIAIGEEFNLRLIDGNGERINNATYSIDDPEICSVSGVTVRGESKGTTEITVRYNGRSYTCIVRVS